MPSTYTTDLAIQLMATGENAGTWGSITNTNLVVVQQAIAGYQGISIAGGAQTTALAMTQNALATARNAVIKLTGTITGNQIVTVPNGIEKTWIVSNGTTGAFTVTFKYASTGTGITWSTTDKRIKILYADGSDIQVVDLSTLSGTIATAQIADYAVGTSQLATNAVTAIKINQSTITQSKLAANSVGINQLISTITQSKLAANSVGSNQLISTGVTAASYTLSSITVDADGRITSASSGSAGAGMEIPVLYATSPGTYTKNNAANRIGIYAIAGGGGGGGNVNYPQPMDPPLPPLQNSGGSGAGGGFGFYNVPTTTPYSQPYSIGSGGNKGADYAGGVAGPGNAGGATTLGPGGSVVTVNGGNGGNGAPIPAPGNPGNPGNQPGSSLTYPTRRFVVGGAFGNGSSGPGNPGVLVIFENTGT